MIASTRVLISAASAWEIATKVRLGKLPEALALERTFVESVEEAGFTILPIEPEVALARAVSSATMATRSTASSLLKPLLSTSR